MDSSGPLSKPENTSFSLLSPSPLERIQQQKNLRNFIFLRLV